MHRLLCLTTLVFATGASAADRYVDDAGTDTGDCAAQASPCGTIAYALAQASSGDTVHVDAGTYSTSGLSFLGDVSLVGAGTGTPRTLLKAGADDVFDFTDASGTVSIEGFAIEQSCCHAFHFSLEADTPTTFVLSDIDAKTTDPTPAAAVRFWIYPGSVIAFEVKNSHFTDYDDVVYGYTSYADTVDLTLTNTTANSPDGYGLDVSFSGSTANPTRQTDVSVTIADSELEAFGTAVGLWGRFLRNADLTLVNNTFTGGQHSVRVAYTQLVASSFTATIADNTIRSPDHGVGLFLDASPNTSFDATIDIRDNTFEPENMGIYLHVPGMADGSLTLQGNTVQGSNATGAAIDDGALLEVGGNGQPDSVLDLVCKDNTITDGNGNGIHAQVVSLGQGSIEVTGNTVEDNTLDGLYLDLAGVGTESRFDVDLGENVVQRNNTGLRTRLRDYGQGSVSVRDNTATSNGYDQLQLRVDNTPDAPGYLDLQVRDNAVEAAEGNYGTGIAVWVEDDNTVLGTVSGNTVSGAGSAGLVFSAVGSANVVSATLSGNTLTGNGDGARMGISDCSSNAVHLDVVGNTITGNGDDGLRIGDTINTENNLIVDLRSNDISDNGGDGVEIDNSYGAFDGRFSGNLLRGNGQNGIHVYEDGDDGFVLTVAHDTISGNADGYAASGFYDVNGAGMDHYDVQAFDNWWGTEDTTTIEEHLYDHDDDADIGDVLFSALSATLSFDLATLTGPASGSTQVLIRATDDVTRFVPSVPGHPLTVAFDAQLATDLAVTNDGKWLWATIPAHAPGVVTVTVTNPGGQSGTASFEYVATFVDADDDGVEDSVDNCPGLANPDQADFDGDEQGDACDSDDDGDGVADTDDNCVLSVNPGQGDRDEDDIGDACDPDADGDGVADAQDNCLGVDNPDQGDDDGDGIGDDCDIDANGDGIADADQIAEEGGSCGCATPAGTPAAGWLLLGLLGLARRRR